MLNFGELSREVIAVTVLTVCWMLWYVFGSPVSYPGGGRRNKLHTFGKWRGRQVRLTHGWRFLSGQASHEETERTSGTGLTLSGEAAGRGIWVPDTSREPSDATFDASTNPNSADQLFRSQKLQEWKGKLPNPAKPRNARAAAHKGLEFYQMLQCEEGHWAGDYGGPMFLMPGLVISLYISGAMEKVLPAPYRQAMIAYLRNHQQSDGGWGTHIESPSTMKGTVLSYVTLRLLGVSADDEDIVLARNFIRKAGGALYTASWAKFWLCTLGVMEWSAHNTVPPEMWLLPRWFPFHPGKLWCHCRMVYLPMCWLYGSRFRADASKDTTLQALRKELYVEPYDSIDWASTRHLIHPADNYSPIGWVMKTLQNVAALYENTNPTNRFRKQALRIALDYINAEDLQTNFVDIGPVNKAMNMLVIYATQGPNSQAFKQHLLRVPDYLWVAEDGMKMQGYNGSQCWDTSFAIQAIAEGEFIKEFPDMCSKVWSYLERTQILSTPVSQSSPAFQYESPEYRYRYYRHVSQGGWPFSTSAHGWPISDCTSEGLKGVLALRQSATIRSNNQLNKISASRLFDAVNVILTLQNPQDGGWATYENNRGYGWYEWLNPSEVFGDIMIDYSYVECSSSSICALVKFRKQFPEHRKSAIDHSIKRGVEFLKSIQRPDGSWYGSWGCCFTYGAWFGVEGLVAAGERESKAVHKACAFLLKHQNANGGWGESFLSCFNKDYEPACYGDGASGVVCTAWALLALISARTPNREAVKRGIQYLMSRQLPSGDWPQQGISGVFNRACGITYTAYRNVFPIWALGRYDEYLRHFSPGHAVE